MDDNRVWSAIVAYMLGSIPLCLVLCPVLSLDVGLTLSLVSFGPVAMALLLLTAWTVSRRLRYAPVEGRLVEASYNRHSMPLHRWSYEFEGRVYEASDGAPALQISYSFEVSPGKRKTVYVDPADPSRLLPPSWKGRLDMYLTITVALLLVILVTVNPELFRSLPW